MRYIYQLILNPPTSSGFLLHLAQVQYDCIYNHASHTSTACVLDRPETHKVPAIMLAYIDVLVGVIHIDEGAKAADVSNRAPCIPPAEIALVLLTS